MNAKLASLLYGKPPTSSGPFELFPALRPVFYKYLDLMFQITFLLFAFVILENEAAFLWKAIALVHGLCLLLTNYGGGTLPYLSATLPLRIMYGMDYVIILLAVTSASFLEGYSDSALGDVRWFFWMLGPVGTPLLLSFEADPERSGSGAKKH